MNPSASLTASSVVFNTGSENFGAITATVTFNDGSANSGIVTGDAQFNGSAINRVAGSISGNAVFADTAVNSGAVGGDATFSASATNNGIVSGTVTHTGGGGSNDQTEYQAWLAANTGVHSYPGAGSHNGQWAYNQTEYPDEASARAAKQADDAAAGNAAYPGWLAANTGVNSYPGAGSHNGQWAYNSTEYGSQADAQAAQTAANESNYQTWLAANSGVNQYTGAGSHNGQWVFDQTEYLSEADAKAPHLENVNVLFAKVFDGANYDADGNPDGGNSRVYRWELSGQPAGILLGDIHLEKKFSFSEWMRIYEYEQVQYLTEKERPTLRLMALNQYGTTYKSVLLPTE